jgi:hypothetical protein
LVVRLGVVVAFASSAAGAVLAQGSVAGNWTLSVDSPQGAMSVGLMLAVDGEAVKGTVSSEMGDAAFTGALKGPEVTFSFDMSGPNGPMTVRTKATVTGDEIKGEMDYGMGVAPFTGKRAEQ